MNIITNTLTKIGLDPSTASIYEYLTTTEETSVQAIQKKTQLSRVAIYNSLNTLLSQGLASYRKEGRNAFYKALHPNQLYSLLEERKREMTVIEKETDQAIQTLAGAFSLAHSQPGVRFIETIEDIKSALYDTLNATEEILTFVEGGVIEAHLKEINEEYVKARLKKGIPKKIITTNDNNSRLHNANLNRTSHTEVKFIDPQKYPFKTSVQIYNDTVLFLTLTNTYKMGFLIKNEIIAELHKSLFKFVWNNLSD